jgi:probable phosphoglycerate mutase
VRIIFIRHGRTQSNVNHLLDTDFPGAPLDEVGEEQAASLPGRLEGEPIEIVMTSDITRARQTGEPIAATFKVPLITHPGVREIFAGDWEMDVEWTGYQEVITSWPKDLDRSMPNGDDGHTFFARFDAAIAELQDYECAVVVSHGGALYTWLNARSDVKADSDPKWRLQNTDIVIVEGEPGAWRILSWGDL